MTVTQLEYKLSQNSGSPIFARLASEYLLLGRTAEAKSLCQSGLENFPAYATGYIILAKCFEVDGDYTSAVQSLSSAIELLPSVALLHDMHVDYLSKLEPRSPVSEPRIDRSIVSDDQNLNTGDIQYSESALVSEEPADPAHFDDSHAEIADAVITELSQESVREILADPETIPSGDLHESGTDIMLQPVDLSPLKDFLDAINTTESPELIVDEPLITEAQTEIREELSPTIPLNDILETPVDAAIPDASVDSELERMTDESGLTGAEEPTVKASEPEEAKHDSGEAAGGFADKPPVEELPDAPVDLTSHNLEGRIVSKTLAEIYAMQGAVAEAILTYQLLRQQRPELREECDARIKELEPKLQEKLSP